MYIFLSIYTFLSIFCITTFAGDVNPRDISEIVSEHLGSYKENASIDVALFSEDKFSMLPIQSFSPGPWHYTEERMGRTPEQIGKEAHKGYYQAEDLNPAAEGGYGMNAYPLSSSSNPRFVLGASISRHFESIGRPVDGLYQYQVYTPEEGKLVRGVIVDYYGGYCHFIKSSDDTHPSLIEPYTEAGYIVINLKTRDVWQDLPQYKQFLEEGWELLADTSVALILFLQDIREQFRDFPLFYRGASHGGTKGALLSLLLASHGNFDSIFTDPYARLFENAFRGISFDSKLVDGIICHDGRFDYLWSNLGENSRLMKEGVPTPVVKKFSLKTPMLILHNADDERCPGGGLELYERYQHDEDSRSYLRMHLTPQGALSVKQQAHHGHASSLDAHGFPQSSLYYGMYIREIFKFLENHLPLEGDDLALQDLRLRHAISLYTGRSLDSRGGEDDISFLTPHKKRAVLKKAYYGLLPENPKASSANLMESSDSSSSEETPSQFFGRQIFRALLLSAQLKHKITPDTPVQDILETLRTDHESWLVSEILEEYRLAAKNGWDAKTFHGYEAAYFNINMPDSLTSFEQVEGTVERLALDVIPTLEDVLNETASRIFEGLDSNNPVYGQMLSKKEETIKTIISEALPNIIPRIRDLVFEKGTSETVKKVEEFLRSQEFHQDLFSFLLSNVKVTESPQEPEDEEEEDEAEEEGSRQEIEKKVEERPVIFWPEVRTFFNKFGITLVQSEDPDLEDFQKVFLDIFNTYRHHDSLNEIFKKLNEIENIGDLKRLALAIKPYYEKTAKLEPTYYVHGYLVPLINLFHEISDPEDQCKVIRIIEKFGDSFFSESSLSNNLIKAYKDNAMYKVDALLALPGEISSYYFSRCLEEALKLDKPSFNKALDTIRSYLEIFPAAVYSIEKFLNFYVDVTEDIIREKALGTAKELLPNGLWNDLLTPLGRLYTEMGEESAEKLISFAKQSSVAKDSAANFAAILDRLRRIGNRPHVSEEDIDRDRQSLIDSLEQLWSLKLKISSDVPWEVRDRMWADLSSELVPLSPKERDMVVKSFQVLFEKVRTLPGSLSHVAGSLSHVAGKFAEAYSNPSKRESIFEQEIINLISDAGWIQGQEKSPLEDLKASLKEGFTKLWDEYPLEAASAISA